MFRCRHRRRMLLKANRHARAAPSGLAAVAGTVLPGGVVVSRLGNGTVIGGCKVGGFVYGHQLSTTQALHHPYGQECGRGGVWSTRRAGRPSVLGTAACASARAGLREAPADNPGARSSFPPQAAGFQQGTTAATTNVALPPLTPDVAIFSQRRPPGVWRPSPGPVSRPWAVFLPAPGPGDGPREAESVERPPRCRCFCVARI